MPYFNQEISSSIINRYEFSKTPSVTHRVHIKMIDEIINKKKKITPENLALTLYSCASVGYFNQEFFDDAILSFKEKKPEIKAIGYIA